MKANTFIKCDNCHKTRSLYSSDYQHINHFCSRRCAGEYSHKILKGIIKDKKLCDICERILQEEYGIKLRG